MNENWSKSYYRRAQIKLFFLSLSLPPSPLPSSSSSFSSDNFSDCFSYINLSIEEVKKDLYLAVDRNQFAHPIDQIPDHKISFIQSLFI